MKIRFLAPVALLAAFVSGCDNNAINKDAHTSFLTSGDLVTMTDKMAAAIIGDPYVQQVTAQKPMVIVMSPIQNETNEIIRRSEKQLYVHRVRVLLTSKPALRGKFVFVLNKDDYEQLQKEESLKPEELGLSEERVQPEYALTGTFYAKTDSNSKGRSDTYLCTFRLTRLSGNQSGIVLWEGSYETVKRVKKEFLD